jgi:hypothetical protein
MKDLPISNEDLIATLKTRLSTGGKTKLNVQIQNDVVYKEYMDLCNDHMKEALKHIVLSNAYVVQALRELAQDCGKIEVPEGKKIKRIPIFNNIVSQIKFIAVDKDYDRLAIYLGLHKRKGAVRTVNSLHNQAVGYCRKAFKAETFDDARIHLNDAADILEFAQDICTDNMIEAAKHCNFDTVIREDISKKSWDWILTNVKGCNL